MKTLELRKKSVKELEELLSKERANIASFHFKSAKGRAKDVKSQMQSRKTIARILTILKEGHEE